MVSASKPSPSGKEALERIGAGERPDFIILDVLMPEIDGLETLRQLMQLDRTLNVIMLSCSNEVTTVVEAIRLGALDYLTKPFEKPELDAAFLKVPPETAAALGEPGAAGILRSAHRGSFVPGRQPADAENSAANSADRAGGRAGIYQRRKRRGKGSGRADDPPSLDARGNAFVKVNCAALPGELLESELFGYEQGAFTGAVRAKPGKFELANKGTIFLDEIAEMSPHLQAKLLHVLQDGQYSRLGRARCRERGCSRSGRHEYGRERSDEHRPLPRRSVLPVECAFDSYSAAARADRRNSAAVPPFPCEVQREISEAGARSFEAFAGSGAALSLARQSARA